MFGARFSSSLLTRSVAASVQRRTMSVVPATMKVRILRFLRRYYWYLRICVFFSIYLYNCTCT
jgi:hypothetical protein